MTTCTGFPPVSCKDARVLILGSLPGVESLKQGRYYAKPQNSFWRIMGALIGATPEIEYEARLHHLTSHHIALWDVCEAAEREGSLDSNIRAPVPNDFATFFKTHKHIELICFNGQPATKLFDKLVRRPSTHPYPPHLTLPSTSPAHAGMRFEEKLARWREALAPFI